MKKFEIFIDNPIKVEVEAENYEQAVQIIKRQLNIPENSGAKFSQAIEVEFNQSEV